MSLGRPELCVGAVAVDHGLLLLVKRGTNPGKGLWSLPGGRVESGESVVAAVLRELKEETGLEGVCGSLVGWVERMGAEYHFVVMDFHGFEQVVDELGGVPDRHCRALVAKCGCDLRFSDI